jgi:toxin ParE1/3/4
MPKLSWTPNARADLKDIQTYSAERHPLGGVQLLRAIQEKARLLERFPLAGPAFDDAFRTLSVVGTRYSLVYRVEQGEIQILRVRHEREDWR